MFYEVQSKEEAKKCLKKNFPEKAEEECDNVIDKKWEDGIKRLEKEIPAKYRNASLSDLGDRRVEIIRVIKKMMNIEDVTDEIGVIFSGEAGTGKSHTAYAVLKSLINFNPSSVSAMYDYQELMADLKKEFYKGIDESSGSIWDSVFNWSGGCRNLLFIDDLSSKRMTDFELEKILMCVNRRINDIFPLFITTNVKQSEFIKVFGERLASRLIGSFHIIEFTGADRRTLKNKMK